MCVLNYYINHAKHKIISVIYNYRPPYFFDIRSILAIENNHFYKIHKVTKKEHEMLKMYIFLHDGEMAYIHAYFIWLLCAGFIWIPSCTKITKVFNISQCRSTRYVSLSLFLSFCAETDVCNYSSLNYWLEDFLTHLTFTASLQSSPPSFPCHSLSPAWGCPFSCREF